MARPKMKRVTLKAYDPRIELTAEGLEALKEELNMRGLSMRQVAKEVGVTNGVAIHLCSEGKGYLSVLKKIIDHYQMKVMIETEGA